MQQPQFLQSLQHQEYSQLLAIHMAQAKEEQELAKVAAMKAEQQVSVAQQRSDAIAGAATHEVEAARKASRETVEYAEEQLRRDAEIQRAQARAAEEAHIGAVKLEAEELHARKIAKQSREYASSIGSNDKELSEARRELEEAQTRLRDVWAETRKSKLRGTRC